jgi:hypothetical protein
MLDTYLIRKTLSRYFDTALRSRLCFAALLCSASACLILFFSIVEENHLAQSELAKFWPRDDLDDYAFASIVAKRSSLQPQKGRIYLTGTAAMREGLLHPDEI